jgi:hypothetical protein
MNHVTGNAGATGNASVIPSNGEHRDPTLLIYKVSNLKNIKPRVFALQHQITSRDSHTKTFER